ncbi:hypothetical protein WA026_001073 [Henosepilachna vigintioctopunctata]|uniref:HTH CENPB-type domain-containing protein n=1 Tax=Henosepilachna vigintioctopunctata TaxID=420089 RepID=A0AAW1UZP3_9CUCU
MNALNAFNSCDVIHGYPIITIGNGWVSRFKTIQKLPLSNQQRFRNSVTHFRPFSENIFNRLQKNERKDAAYQKEITFKLPQPTIEVSYKLLATIAPTEGRD